MTCARPRNLLAAVVFVFAFVVNPGYVAGCAGARVDGGEPEFGEEEMLDLLDEANAMGPWPFEHDGASYEIELSLVQKQGDDDEDVSAARRGASFTRRAHACVNRSFQQAASACVSITTVPLEATVTLRRTDVDPAVEIVSEAPLDAQLRAFGVTLGSALVEVGVFPYALVLTTTDRREFELASVTGRALDLAAQGIDYSPTQ